MSNPPIARLNQQARSKGRGWSLLRYWPRKLLDQKIENQLMPLIVGMHAIFIE